MEAIPLRLPIKLIVMTNENKPLKGRDLCPSCMVKLSLVLNQLNHLEKLFSMLKTTLNFQETCLYTGMSPSQLYKLTKSNKIPYYKPTGKLLFFNKQELDEWLCRHQEENMEEKMNESNQQQTESYRQDLSEVPDKNEVL